MKKATIYILFLTLVYTLLPAQPKYFNQIYQADSISMLSVAVAPIQNGYLVSGGFNGAAGYSATYLRKINLYGETEWTQILDGAVQYSTMIFGNSMIRLHEGNNIAVFTKGASSTTRNFALVQFTDQGQILQSRVYTRPDFLDGNAQIIATHDGGYAISGWTSNQVTGTGSKYCILKLDANFNLVWEAAYGTWATTIYAEQTQDSGFLISGYRYSSSTGYDMYVVKTDSMGAMQWQRTYGTNQDDGGCRAFQLADGSLMLLGTIKILTNNKNGLYLARLNAANGAIVGEAKTHQKNELYGSEVFYYSPTKDRIMAVTVAFNPPPKWEIAFTAISTQGDILWEKPISSGLAHNKDYIRDIEPTPDGGYVLAGFNYASPQSSWVLKVDSLGNTCGIAPCYSDYPVGIAPTPQGSKAAPATVYPNPVPAGSSTAQIRYSLPPQLPFGVWELYNLQGQKVRYQVLAAPPGPLKGEIIQSLDLAGVAPGMYVWRLALPGGYEQHEASGKLVVEVGSEK